MAENKKTKRPHGNDTDLEAENDRLKTENDDLKKRLCDLEQLIHNMHQQQQKMQQNQQFLIEHQQQQQHDDSSSSSAMETDDDDNEADDEGNNFINALSKSEKKRLKKENQKSIKEANRIAAAKAAAAASAAASAASTSEAASTSAAAAAAAAAAKGAKGAQVTNNNNGKVGNMAKPPQIILGKCNIKELTLKIKNILKNEQFMFNYNRIKETTTLQLTTIDDFNKVKLLLKQKGHQFWTFTPKGEKPKTLIMKYLPEYYSEDDVLKAVENLGPIIKVAKHKIHWMIQFGKSADIENILKTKYILMCRIRFEKFKGADIVQCKNCQRYNHTASNCNMPYRCVKCGEQHGAKNCTLKMVDEHEVKYVKQQDGSWKKQTATPKPVFCINCGNNGHTANYKKCPVYQQEIKNKKKAVKQTQQKQQPKREVYVARQVTREVSFADALRNNIDTQQATQGRNAAQTAATPSQQGNFLNKECNELFGKGMTEIFAKFNSFAPSYNKGASKEERQMMMFQLFMDVCCNE